VLFLLLSLTPFFLCSLDIRSILKTMRTKVAMQVLMCPLSPFLILFVSVCELLLCFVGLCVSSSAAILPPVLTSWHF
jgi:hypothetical protein